MVGTEFVDMWRWITTIDLDDLPITPGLSDVPTRVADIAVGRPHAAGG